MPTHIYIGIDPGLTGAFAVLEDHHLHPTGKPKFLAVHDLPIDPRNPKRLDPHALSRLLQPYIFTPRPSSLHLALETSQGLKAQGASSIFNYGVTTGIIRATLELMTPDDPNPIVDIAPASWKRTLGLLTTDPDDKSNLIAARKQASLYAARELYPAAIPELARVKDHNRAEALLIAHWLVMYRTEAIPGMQDMSYRPRHKTRKLRA